MDTFWCMEKGHDRLRIGGGVYLELLGGILGIKNGNFVNSSHSFPLEFSGYVIARNGGTNSCGMFFVSKGSAPQFLYGNESIYSMTKDGNYINTLSISLDSLKQYNTEWLCFGINA